MLNVFLASWLVAPLAPQTPGEIRCTVSGNLALAPRAATIDGVPVSMQFAGDELVFTDVPATGSAKVRLGKTLVDKDVTWSNGRCAPVVLPAAVLYGFIDSRPGAAHRITACGEEHWIDAGAAGYVIPLEEDSCLVEVVRFDGYLEVYDQAEQPVLIAGADRRYDVRMPATMQGGMGIRFLPSADGVRVMDVLYGSPAYDAGIRAGDRIEQIDGVPVGGWSSERFLRHAVGDLGTEVVVDVFGTQGNRPVRIIREVID